MDNLFEVLIIAAPALVFITATVLYGTLFHIDSFQGKAMIFLLVSLSVIFGLNLGLNVVPLISGTVPAWFYAVSIAAFILITLAGIVLCVSIVRARKKAPDG